MIALLLMVAASLLSGIGVGVYLLVRPDPQEEAAPEPTQPTPTGPPTTAPPPTTPPGTTTRPGGPATGTGSTVIERPPDTSGDLQAVARDYVAAVNDRDEAEATGLTCDRAEPGTLFSVAEGRAVTLVEAEVIEGSVASATVRVGGEETALLLERREDGWCVAI
jgi:hypothetical protein